MTSMKKCIRCYVSGKVQGVFYRASTQEQAESLGVTGYAKNLADRRVEVLACGDERALAELKSWLWQGPRHSEVTAVECDTINPTPVPQGFVTK
ncbi:acylphosphatase [Kaarinaea lacus]